MSLMYMELFFLGTLHFIKLNMGKSCDISEIRIPGIQGFFRLFVYR